MILNPDGDGVAPDALVGVVRLGRAFASNRTLELF
jgi:hypothetical protein